MIRANDRTLEQRPNVLKRISVSQTAHIFAVSVVNRYMDRVVVANSNIAGVRALIVSVLGEVNTTRR